MGKITKKKNISSSKKRVNKNNKKKQSKRLFKGGSNKARRNKKKNNNNRKLTRRNKNGGNRRKGKKSKKKIPIMSGGQIGKDLKRKIIIEVGFTQEELDKMIEIVDKINDDKITDEQTKDKIKMEREKVLNNNFIIEGLINKIKEILRYNNQSQEEDELQKVINNLKEYILVNDPINENYVEELYGKIPDSYKNSLSPQITDEIKQKFEKIKNLMTENKKIIDEDLEQYVLYLLKGKLIRDLDKYLRVFWTAVKLNEDRLAPIWEKLNKNDKQAIINIFNKLSNSPVVIFNFKSFIKELKTYFKQIISPDNKYNGIVNLVDITKVNALIEIFSIIKNNDSISEQTSIEEAKKLYEDLNNNQ